MCRLIRTAMTAPSTIYLSHLSLKYRSTARKGRRLRLLICLRPTTSRAEAIPKAGSGLACRGGEAHSRAFRGGRLVFDYGLRRAVLHDMTGTFVVVPMKHADMMGWDGWDGMMGRGLLRLRGRDGMRYYRVLGRIVTRVTIDPINGILLNDV